MIGDAQILQAKLVSGLGHLFQAGRAVAPGRVAMEGAEQITRLDEPGQMVLGGGEDFAGVLTQFGLNVIELQSPVDVGFVLARQRGVSRNVKQLVFIQLETILNGPLPQGDVVLLAAGEVVESEGKLGIGNDTQVGVHDNLVHGQNDARFGLAMSGNALYRRELDEGVHDGAGILGADEKVDVLDRLTPPSQLAAQFQANDAGTFSQGIEQVLGEGQGLIEPDPFARLADESDAFKNLLLRLGPKSFEDWQRRLFRTPT